MAPFAKLDALRAVKRCAAGAAVDLALAGADLAAGGQGDVALALLMTVPLLWYVRIQATQAWQKPALLAAGALTLIAIIGTNSRGALLGLLATGLFFLMKARNRFGIILALIPVALVVLYVMPPEWFDRMHTIESYEEDASAMGRIYAWGNAIELANMNFFGGGFRAVTGYGGTDSHSNWFGALGELGWIGLCMFVLLHIFTWRSAAQIIRLSKPPPRHSPSTSGT